MQLLTKEQIAKIRELQKNLDIHVRENNDIPMDQDLNLEKYIALKTEFFEFVNEVESFKYWKKNKGKPYILEEASDVLHFIFSLAIDNNTELELDEEFIKGFDVNKYEINDLIGITDAMISDSYANQEWETLNGVLTMLIVLINKCGLDANDLYEEYMRKNKINHERQANNY